MGLARRNLENHERDKTVKIMQRFSFDFEEAKVMIANLVPGVKNLDADHTFYDEAMKKRFSLGRCCKNQECVLAPSRQQEKTMSGVMRGSADSLKLRKSQAGTTKMQ